ncbi:MAG: hypothetical protein FJ098_13125 [Deltaproteobacteria bacterium]|nr:hypothetical protein [Deltaproteobacteria bacterium]
MQGRLVGWMLVVALVALAPRASLAQGGPEKAVDESAERYLSPIRAEAQKMTYQEMVKEGAEIIADIRAMKDAAEERLRKAREDKAIETMDSINDALIALKGVLRLAEGYYYDLKSKASDLGAARTEFIKLRIAHNKAMELDAQIRAAGGPGDQGVVEGRPVIQWKKDKDLPFDSVVDELSFWEVYLERPQIPSPFH